jgi:alpha-amylase/alpha-mannosidase (GH57 family)
MSTARLELVFLWHMHQPDYRDRETGTFVMPWTLLHALKDYTDMAGHFERHPTIRGVVNFVPILLDQIEDYVDQCATQRFRDPWLRWLSLPHLGHLPSGERRLLLEGGFRSNAATMLAAFPHYQRLQVLYDSLASEGETALNYLSGAFLADLLVWYLLVWTGETERRQEPLLAELMAKGEGFDHADRQRLLDYIGRTLTGLLPRYRALQARGQIELSTTPATHPLSPLLLDFRVARESQANAPLPQAESYPGGRERVRKQLEQAHESHTRRFGQAPVGMWPAEGALSSAFVGAAAQAGCRWLATGENVLKHSLGQSVPGSAYHPWRHGNSGDRATPLIFFRDDRLSDMIGFEYARWHGRDAAADFVRQLEAIVAAAPAGETPVVSVILDGENAWEYYPYNGYYFFDDLYGLLEQHPMIRTSTFASVVEERDRPAVPAAGHSIPPVPEKGFPPVTPTLSTLIAGSWVHGTLSTWIGDPAKNRAWDLLCAAKQSYDQVIASGRLSPAEHAAAEAQLAVCESSDWFWWFGDYNPGPAVASFDRLFRSNLARLYRSLNLAPPVQLDHAISAGRTEGASLVAVAAGGTMRRGNDSLEST